MLDCIVYISSVANFRKHHRKTQCLENFAAGVKSIGNSILIEQEYRYRKSHLAVILGWATTNIGGANIALRKQIIEQQNLLGTHTMCIDASCWKYLDNSDTYLRYSLGGPFYDRAEYANHASGPEKWNEIQSRLGVSLTTSNPNPNGHILICMQRDGGFAMKTLDPVAWLAEKIPQIRARTNRSIWIRPHPSAQPLRDLSFLTSQPGITVTDSKKTRLTDDLAGAHSVIVFNSSASVAAVCAGIPVFADDSSCVSWAVSNHSVDHIESPQQFDCAQWINDLAAAHWSDEDGSSGRIYQKFLPFINK